MAKNVQITEHITIGAQPAEQDLEQLREEGFQTIVNFRLAGEDDQPMSPEEEGEKVESLGMEYFHLPVKDFRPEAVDQFRHALTNLPTPVFAHCKAGTRAGIMAILNVAVDREWSGDQAVEKGKELGLKFKPEHVDFIKQYADDHITQT